MPFVAGLRLVRNKRRVPLPVLFLLAQLLQRRLRAKGGAFAFAPTPPLSRIELHAAAPSLRSGKIPLFPLVA
jgi:hypothetical protein